MPFATSAFHCRARPAEPYVRTVRAAPQGSVAATGGKKLGHSESKIIHIKLVNKQKTTNVEVQTGGHIKTWLLMKLIQPFVMRQ